MTDYIVTRHAEQRCAEKGIALDIILDVLDHPETTYPAFQRDAQGRRTPTTCAAHGGESVRVIGESNGVRVAAVVLPCCHKVITIHLDKVATTLRADQIAAGVTSYRDVNGRLVTA